MRKLLIASLFLAMLGVDQTFAQDFHFTQFYANSQLLNPALTGNFKEDYRVNFIHRDQWSGIGSKFQTSAFGGDINLKGGKLNRDKVGIGAQVYLDDQAGILTTQGFLLSGSYIHTLDGHRRHHLGGGLQIGYMGKDLNTDDFQFGSQYHNQQYNGSLSNQENFAGYNVSNVTIQAGVTYNFNISKTTELFSGLSAYQLTSPDESVIGTENKLGRRYVFFTGVEHQLNNKLKVRPQFMYMTQSKAADFNLGGLLYYELVPVFKTNLILGAFYRSTDAAIVVAGLQHRGLEAKFSYDMTLSDLTNAEQLEGAAPNNVAGAWEVSVIFKGVFRKHNYPNDYTVPCGIF